MEDTVPFLDGFRKSVEEFFSMLDKSLGIGEVRELLDIIESASGSAPSSPGNTASPYPNIRDWEAYISTLRKYMDDLAYMRLSMGRTEPSESVDGPLEPSYSLRFGSALLDRASRRLRPGSMFGVFQGERAPNFNYFMYPFLLLLATANRSSLNVMSLLLTRNEIINAAGSSFTNMLFTAALSESILGETRIMSASDVLSRKVQGNVINVLMLDSSTMGGSPLTPEALNEVISNFQSLTLSTGTYGAVFVRRDYGMSPDLVSLARMRIQNVIEFSVEKNSPVLQFSGFMSSNTYVLALEKSRDGSMMINPLSVAARGRDFY